MCQFLFTVGNKVSKPRVFLYLSLERYGPIFQNLVLWFILRTITPKMHIQNSSWKGQTVWMYQVVLYFAVAYILLCKPNYGYHNQTRFN